MWQFHSSNVSFTTRKWSESSTGPSETRTTLQFVSLLHVNYLWGLESPCCSTLTMSGQKWRGSRGLSRYTSTFIPYLSSTRSSSDFSNSWNTQTTDQQNKKKWENEMPTYISKLKILHLKWLSAQTWRRQQHQKRLAAPCVRTPAWQSQPHSSWMFSALPSCPVEITCATVFYELTLLLFSTCVDQRNFFLQRTYLCSPVPQTVHCDPHAIAWVQHDDKMFSDNFDHVLFNRKAFWVLLRRTHPALQAENSET